MNPVHSKHDTHNKQAIVEEKCESISKKKKHLALGAGQ